MARKIEDNRNKLHSWILNHDHSLLFIVSYIGLAVVLSSLVSLFWLVVVVGAHFVLELITQHHLKDTLIIALAETIWELRLDFALIIFSIAVVVYIELALGVAGLSLAPRAGHAISVGVRGASRAAAWSRVLRIFLLSLDEMAQVLRVAVFGRRKKKISTGEEERKSSKESDSKSKEEELNPSHSSWFLPWSTGDYLVGAFFIASIIAVIVAPLFTAHTWNTLTSLILSEMQPLPGS